MSVDLQTICSALICIRMERDDLLKAWRQRSLTSLINEYCAEHEGVLDLSGRQDLQELGILCEALKTNRNVKSLILSDFKPRLRTIEGWHRPMMATNLFSYETSIEAVCDLLKSNTTLTSLELSNNELDTDQASQLLIALIGNPKSGLLNLNLDHNKIQMTSSLSRLLIATQKLERISLKSNDMNANSIKGIECLVKSLHKNSTLMECNLDGSAILSRSNWPWEEMKNAVLASPAGARYITPITFFGSELSRHNNHIQRMLQHMANDSGKRAPVVGEALGLSPLPYKVAQIVGEYLNLPFPSFEEGFKKGNQGIIDKKKIEARQAEETKNREERPKEYHEGLDEIVARKTKPERNIFQVIAPFLAVAAILAIPILFILGAPLITALVPVVLGGMSLVSYGLSKPVFSQEDGGTSTAQTLPKPAQTAPVSQMQRLDAVPQYVDVVEVSVGAGHRA